MGIGRVRKTLAIHPSTYRTHGDMVSEHLKAECRTCASEPKHLISHAFADDEYPSDDGTKSCKMKGARRVSTHVTVSPTGITAAVTGLLYCHDKQWRYMCSVTFQRDERKR